MTEQSGQHLSEEPQEERGAPGSRDTGSDHAAGGTSGRVPGDLDQEETTSVDDEDEQSGAAFTTGLPRDVKPAVPPYEGRKETANPEGATATGEVGGVDVGGATSPASTDSADEPAPSSTPGGEYASPANESPVGRDEELEDDPGGVGGPSHTTGVERGEDQR
jgi:hypothetical protein